MKTLATFSRWLAGAALFLFALVPVRPNPAAVDGPDCLPKEPPPPVVKLKLRVPACAAPGQTIEYRVCVENCSPSEAHHVVVKDALPANAKFVKADPLPTKHGDELQWHLGTIGGGATREIRLWLVPTNREDVKNCLRVQFEHGLCVVTRQTGHPGAGPGPFPGPGEEPFDPSKPPIVRPVPEVKPDATSQLEVSFRGPNQQYVNLDARYEIIVTNKGKTKATNAQISCTVAEKLKIVKTSDPGVVEKNVVAWKLGDIEPGVSRSVLLTLRATEKGKHCFAALAESDLGVRREADFCTTFVGVSALSIEMNDRVDPVFLGEKTSFPVIVKSLGSDAVTGVRLKAFVPDALKLVKTVPLFEKRDPVKGGEWIEFLAFPKVESGEQARYEIFVEAAAAGRTRFHIEVMADQLDPNLWVIWEELTTIVDDRKK